MTAYVSPEFIFFFFLCVRSCYSSVGRAQGLSAQTAGLSVLWTLLHCQVSALSQFPTHTVLCSSVHMHSGSKISLFVHSLHVFCISVSYSSGRSYSKNEGAKNIMTSELK